MRAEGLASTGQLANMLEESKLGLGMGVHVYYQHENKTDPASPLEDPTPHIAAFMLMRQASPPSAPRTLDRSIIWVWTIELAKLVWDFPMKVRPWRVGFRAWNAARRQDYWYFFGSTGWLDGDWRWSDAFSTPTQPARLYYKIPTNMLAPPTHL
jgi:hypothetical protein